MGTPNTNLKGFNHAVYTLLRHPAQFLPHLTIPNFTHLPETETSLGAHLYRAGLDADTQPPAPAERHEKHPSTPKIRALVLDKDATLCPSKTTTFPPSILLKLTTLRTSPSSPFNMTQNPHAILIVSNRAGSHARYEDEAVDIERKLKHLKIEVFRLPGISPTHTYAHTHTTSDTVASGGGGGGGGGVVEKKPFCGAEVVEWFKSRGVIQSAHEIAVVGDRLGTDVLMAVQMGSWAVWCRDGVGGVDGLSTEMGPGKRGVLERMEVWMERYLREGRSLKAPLPRGWR